MKTSSSSFGFVATYGLLAGLALTWTQCTSDETGSANADGGGTTGGTTAGTTGAATTAGSTTGGSATITDVTTDQPTKIVYLGALPSGNLVGTEGREHRVVEIEPTGKVVAVNDTDFTGSNWPLHVAVNDQGHVFISGYQVIVLYANGIKGTKTDFVTAEGNGALSNVAWGGTPKRLWAMSASNPTAPKTKVVRYDAATATAGGTPTVIGEVDTSAYQSMVVDEVNNAYMVDFNKCRLVKMTSAGQVSVLAGKPLAESGVCTTGSFGKDGGGHFGQGSALGFDPTGKKVLYSDTRNHALLDMTEDTDGKSKVAAVVTFPEGVENGYFVASKGALYVVDGKTFTLKKVTF